MGHQIAKGDTFLGLPAIAARDTLRDWVDGRWRDPFSMTPTRATPHDAVSRIAILSEMTAMGWFSSDTAGYSNARLASLTPEARSFMAASMGKRIPRDRALAMANEVIANAAAFNGLPRQIKTIPRIWLFGSLIDDSRHDVGDIDIVIEQDFSPWYLGLGAEDKRRADGEAAGQVGARTFMQALYAPEQIARTAALGGRKRPAISLADVGALKSLGCPCRLVYDIGAGASIDAPNLRRHPDSKGRQKDLGRHPGSVNLTPAKSIAPCQMEFPTRLLNHWRARGRDARNLGVGHDEAIAEIAGVSGRAGFRTGPDALEGAPAAIADYAARLAATSGTEIVIGTKSAWDGREIREEANTAIAVERTVGAQGARATIRGMADAIGAADAIAPILCLIGADALRAAARRGGQAKIEIIFPHGPDSPSAALLADRARAWIAAGILGKTGGTATVLEQGRTVA